MEIKKKQKYKTPSGTFLKVKTVRDTGMHTLILIDKDGNPLPEKRNKRGHVIQRTTHLCTNETIRTFKQIK
ncbi:hypothetical protein [Flavobacterium anhuiense]|uniref:hypothetical protein n=1 Tax=Flavobacterium anhuiense TaxID=459526 RepID=UPI0020267EEC|nr:hypothetical protein [Flavobacterium anhuiense]URM37191.1 hypothetical protein LLY39_00940 [Flavobacterium anhuiense]